MRIVVLPPRGVSFPLNSPWNALLDGLRDAGHEVSGYGTIASRPDALVAMNDQPEARRIQAEFDIPRGRSALILLEPRVTAPHMYQRSSLDRYAYRFAASPHWARFVGGSSFKWPQDIAPQAMTAISSDSPFAASLINGEKRSAVRGSLYGLRRAVIQCFDNTEIRLAVAGPGWQDSPYHRLKLGTRAVAKTLRAGMRPNMSEAFSAPGIRPLHWLGCVDEKSIAFACSPVTLVIENSLDYVSEKLIDALRNHVVPVYVGPPLEEFGIPSDLAISSAPRALEILKHVISLSPARATEILERGGTWLASGDARSHEASRVLCDLGRSIGRTLGDGLASRHA